MANENYLHIPKTNIPVLFPRTLANALAKQGMTLLLFKKISLPAKLLFQLILFYYKPENNIGYEY